MNDGRIIAWFSCGAASAVAAKSALTMFGSERVEVVCCDTRPSEHPDNYRFSEDCERWFGKKITYLRSDKYPNVDEVFIETRYMSGVRGARCTIELKKVPRFHFQKPDDTHIFGFTSEEGRRIKTFRANNHDLSLYFILYEFGFTKAKCYAELSKAGIELPAMYRLGFDNNNCPGCVKASSPWYWAMIRRHFPEVFKRRCEQSRELGVRLVEISHHKRIFLDELPDKEFRRRGTKENLSCGPECAPTLESMEVE